MSETMWFQLLFLLVASAAAQDDDNDNYNNSCRVMLYHECEEPEEPPSEMPGTKEELEEFCKYAMKYFDCAERVLERECEGKEEFQLRAAQDLIASIRRVCVEDPLLHSAIAAILPCYKKNRKEIDTCHRNFEIPSEHFSSSLLDIGINVTRSNHPEENACLFAIKFFDCIERVLEKCEGKELFHLDEVQDLIGPIRRVCAEDSLLLKPIAAILPCYKEISEEIDTCDLNFEIHVPSERFLSSLVDLGINVTSSNDSEENACLNSLYRFACVAATSGRICGDNARDVIINLAQGSDTHFQDVCPQNMKEKLPEIVEVLQIEAQKGEAVGNSIKKKK